MSSIKLVHFADVHLGVENYGSLDFGTGLSTRLVDFMAAIDRIIDTALAEQADLVIFAGDAYKTRDPSPTYQREFARRIRRLSEAHVPTVLVAGNHDVPNATGRAHTMEIFHTLEIDHIYVARTPEVFDITTRHGPVQVGVLPWIVRSGLLSREEYKNRNLQEITRLLVERVERILDNQDGLASRLRPEMPHILAVHGTVQGAIYGSERTVMLGQEMILPLSLLKNPQWDYVAMGHIHRHQALETERFPPVVYAGSIERIDFGEEREEKGFIIAQIEPHRCTWEFHPLPARRFVTVPVTADSQDPTADVVRAIERADIQDTVVRVIIHTTADRDLLIREHEIRRALKDTFFTAAIIHDVVHPDRLRLGNQQEIASLTPFEALEKYLEIKQTPPERIATLMRYAESLLTSDSEK
jgi:exonuclease SbcD